MKQSHLRTPRTQAECQFTTGYAEATHPLHRSSERADRVIFALFCAFLAGLLLGVV